MGKDLGSWLCPHPLDGQSLNAKPSKLPLRLGMQGSGVVHAPPTANMYDTAGFPWMADSTADQVKEPHGLFYCLPSYGHDLTANANMAFHEKISKDTNSAFESPTDASTPNLFPRCASKRFVVFDQSGDKTTMILGPGTGTPVKCPTCWTPNPIVGCYFNAEEQGSRADIDHSPSGPNLMEELNDEGRGTDDESVMREDTEEIDALLYSENESDYTDEEDHEEASTGHSPSMMTVYDKQANCFVEEEGMEEVASSDGLMKRQKLSNGVCQMPLMFDEVSSQKRESSAEYEDDAQSSCVGGDILKCDDVGCSTTGKKRSRTEKIRETVNILQSIIPGGKGKNAIIIIDEAIHYLRSLKHEAESLGLSDL